MAYIFIDDGPEAEEFDSNCIFFDENDEASRREVEDMLLLPITIRKACYSEDTV